MGEDLESIAKTVPTTTRHGSGIEIYGLILATVLNASCKSAPEIPITVRTPDLPAATYNIDPFGIKRIFDAYVVELNKNTQPDQGISRDIITLASNPMFIIGATGDGVRCDITITGANLAQPYNIKEGYLPRISEAGGSTTGFDFSRIAIASPVSVEGTYTAHITLTPPEDSEGQKDIGYIVALAIAGNSGIVKAITVKDGIVGKDTPSDIVIVVERDPRSIYEQYTSLITQANNIYSQIGGTNAQFAAGVSEMDSNSGFRGIFSGGTRAAGRKDRDAATATLGVQGNQLRSISTQLRAFVMQHPDLIDQYNLYAKDNPEFQPLIEKP